MNEMQDENDWMKKMNEMVAKQQDLGRISSEIDK